MKKLSVEMNYPEYFKKLHNEQKKYILMVRNDVIYAYFNTEPEKTQVWCTIFPKNIGDVYCEEIDTFHPTDIIYTFDSVIEVYETLRRGRCLDKFKHVVQVSSIHAVVEKEMADGKIVGCNYLKTNNSLGKRRLINEDGRTFDDSLSYGFDFKNNSYSDYISFDSTLEAMKWLRGDINE